MSEAMISESVIEAEWILRGYWTQMRYPYQTQKGGWSDIDVLAYNPESKHLVISESKIQGPKKDIFAYTAHTKSVYGTILEHDNNNYFSFLEGLPIICSNGVIFSNFSKMVKKLTIQLVSNYVIDTALQQEAETTVLNRVQTLIPNSRAKIDVRLNSTMDIIANVVELEDKNDQGRRYGHPMLDIAREINRYSRPNIRFAGQGKEKTSAIREQAISALKSAIN